MPRRPRINLAGHPQHVVQRRIKGVSFALFMGSAIGVGVELFLAS
jgi:hypothetical protein